MSGSLDAFSNGRVLACRAKVGRLLCALGPSADFAARRATYVTGLHSALVKKSSSSLVAIPLTFSQTPRPNLKNNAGVTI
jgi:hypothetical protein